ncbi:MAG: PQQ-binding-like beta-propeller repeat protein [Planctomycetaceae bacterium]|nr:PQQ-binding-like beta-propeller repeat protein [Planctomycetaceae bacterium]
MTLAAPAEDWPRWRGPRGDGTSLEENVPVEWDAATGKNITWKIPVPGLGHSCPVISGDHLFLTTFLPETNERQLLCHDRPSGEIRWRKTVFEAPVETKHTLNSHASSTPVTDGEWVFVMFLKVDGSTIPAPNVGTPRPVTPGEIVVAAYDFGGEQQWLVSIGEFISAHGFASSPILFEDTVIINGDHDGEGYLAALNKSSGETIWKVARPHGIRSYCTPLIREVHGRTQMVVSGSQSIISYDPRDGSEHWRIEGPAEQFVSSMVYDGKYFYMACGYPTYHVMAINPDGSGDVTETHVVWHSEESKSYVPSPVLAEGGLFVPDDRGTASCYDTKTGERVWRARLGQHFSPSLVTADGYVYFVADDGTTKVVKADKGPEAEVVAENELGERCSASPAIAHGHLYIRTHEHLFAIGPAE